jgi:uncharacterized membrane protein YbhN (UPF0104 family)
VVSVAVGGLWTTTHGVAGVPWTVVGSVLLSVPPWRLALLAAIWLGGLGVYSVVLSAAMPGLGMRRGLLLNLSGSAVANTVPLGGAVATGLNWRMARAWGHSDRAFAAYCLLTNALDVVTKLLLPLVAVATLGALSAKVPRPLWAVAAGCAVCLGALLLLRVVVVASRRDGVGRPAGRPSSLLLERHLRGSGARIRRLLVTRWHRLVPASIGYVAAQIALLLFAFRAVGLSPSTTVVLTAAAIERLSTLVPLTPGGTGVAEVGTVAWLVASGVDPAKAVAGVLVYRLFLVAMEVPVGGVLLAWWAWVQRHATSRPLGEAPA